MTALGILMPWITERPARKSVHVVLMSSANGWSQSRPRTQVCWMRILNWMMIGVSHPKGSKSFDVDESKFRFVSSSLSSSEHLKTNWSRFGCQKYPKPWLCNLQRITLDHHSLHEDAPEYSWLGQDHLMTTSVRGIHSSKAHLEGLGWVVVLLPERSNMRLLTPVCSLSQTPSWKMSWAWYSIDNTS